MGGFWGLFPKWKQIGSIENKRLANFCFRLFPFRSSFLPTAGAAGSDPPGVSVFVGELYGPQGDF
jgi:hypothetical protein